MGKVKDQSRRGKKGLFSFSALPTLTIKFKLSSLGNSKEDLGTLAAEKSQLNCF